MGWPQQAIPGKTSGRKEFVPCHCRVLHPPQASLFFWGIHPGWQKKGSLMYIGFCGTIGPLRVSPSLLSVRSSQKTPSVFARVCGPEEKAPGPGQPSSLFRQGSTLGLLAASFCGDGELPFLCSLWPLSLAGSYMSAFLGLSAGSFVEKVGQIEKK